MNQLDLLWELENQKTVLEKYKKDFHEIRKNKNLEEIIEKVNSLKNSIVELKHRLYTSDLLLKDNNKSLIEYNYKITRLRKELYGGIVTDLDQLDYMNKEKDKLKLKIDSLEIDILTLMDQIERMDLELVSLEKDLFVIENKLEEFKYNKSVNLRKLENDINKAESKLKLLEDKIDLKLLERFNILRNTRQSSVVKVKEGICTGCNMRIPTYQIDIIKSKNEIVYCESCGRILYFICIID